MAVMDRSEFEVPGGWWSRGYVPHFDAACIVQHVTYRLADSLPAPVLARLEEELCNVPPDRRNAERRRWIEGWIDQGWGSSLLRFPPAARLVQDVFLRFDTQRYRLLAWVVMPNHVHVLLEVLVPWSLPRIVASWSPSRTVDSPCSRQARTWSESTAVSGSASNGIASSVTRSTWRRLGVTSIRTR